MTGTPEHRPWRGGRTPRTALAVPLAMLVAGALVWNATGAVFTANTGNAANSFTTGTVALTDDDAGAAAFTATGLQRGATAARCIAVTYGGSLTAPVKLYASSPTGTLGPYLDLVIEQGTGGSFADCTGFSPSSTLFTGTLAAFTGSATSFSSGVGAWTATGSGETRTFRLTYTLQPGAPSTAQNTSATAQFVWEARA